MSNMTETIIEIGSETDLVHLRYENLPGTPEEIAHAAVKMTTSDGTPGPTVLERMLEDTHQRRRVFEPEFVRIADDSGEIGVLLRADDGWVWNPAAH